MTIEIVIPKHQPIVFEKRNRHTKYIHPMDYEYMLYKKLMAQGVESLPPSFSAWITYTPCSLCNKTFEEVFGDCHTLFHGYGNPDIENTKYNQLLVKYSKIAGEVLSSNAIAESGFYAIKVWRRFRVNMGLIPSLITLSKVPKRDFRQCN
jgi:hypothetical protein